MVLVATGIGVGVKLGAGRFRGVSLLDNPRPAGGVVGVACLGVEAGAAGNCRTGCVVAPEERVGDAADGVTGCIGAIRDCVDVLGLIGGVSRAGAAAGGDTTRLSVTGGDCC